MSPTGYPLALLAIRDARKCGWGLRGAWSAQYHRHAVEVIARGVFSEVPGG